MKYLDSLLRKTGIRPKKKTPIKRENEEGLIYKIIEGENQPAYIRIEGIGKDTDILTIPSQIDGLNVEVIKKGAFQGNCALRQVKLTENIRQIGANAFKGCRLLTCAELPMGLEIISKSCFEDCSALEKVSVPSSLKKIYPDAFKGCICLEKFVFSSDVEHVGRDAFKDTKVRAGMLKGYTQVFTVDEVCRIIGAELPKELNHLKDTELVNLACHTKFAEDGGAYVAINPSREALRTAIEKNVKVIFVDESYVDEENLLSEAACIPVASTYDVIGKIISAIKDRVGFKVVGITGSIGKTTTKELVYHVLKTQFKTARGLGNENTIYPLFNNMQRIPDDLEYFVQEYGMGEPGAMGKTVDACIPDAAVMTSISLPHIELYGTMENILKEKRQLIDKMAEGAPAILCYDSELLKNAEFPGRTIFSYAMDEAADFTAENIAENEGVITFDAAYFGEKTPLELNLFGKYNVNNGLCAFAIGRWAGVSAEKIKAGLAEYCPSAKGFRQNFIELGGQSLYLDCYNSTPDSLISAVEVLSKLPVKKDGRRIAVLGEFLMLVKEEEKEIHQETARKIREMNVDAFVCFGGENAKYMAEELAANSEKEVFRTEKREELNQWLRAQTTINDTILFKGCNAAMLFKTVDQVYGTFFHRVAHEKEDKIIGDTEVRFIYEDEQKNRENATAAVMNYTGKEKRVEIPESYNGVPVFAVGANAFDCREELEEAVLADSIVHLGDFSFARCKALTFVHLPASLKIIGKGAFRGCRNLKRIEIPEGTTEIGEIAFKNCYNLEEAVIPDSVKKIAEDAFLGCEKLELTKDYSEVAE